MMKNVPSKATLPQIRVAGVNLVSNYTCKSAQLREVTNIFGVTQLPEVRGQPTLLADCHARGANF